jgi:hypothetical protein
MNSNKGGGGGGLFLFALLKHRHVDWERKLELFVKPRMHK